ncbi:hypothetical protein BH23PLA1_BH23PLA1_14550 [soil metagenome]
MKPRRAFTLIEMIVSMTAGAIVLGLCAGLIHSLLRLERTSREGLIESASLARLDHEFRLDIHACKDYSIVEANEGDGPRIELSLPGDERIEYQAVDEGILRIRRSDGDRVRRELYRLGQEPSIRWEIESQEDVDLLILHLALGADRRREQVRIEAVRGRDHRYHIQKNQHEE